jgi:histone H3/H4
MARTKHPAPKQILDKKPPVSGSVEKPLAIVGKKKRRSRSGMAALRQMRRLQRSTKLVIPKLPFRTIVRTIDAHLVDGVSHRFTSCALDALQEGAEAYLDEVFKNSNAISINGKSVTLKARDMLCAVQVMKQYVGHAA